MANDRNLTTHTYNEALAERIGSHLAAHARLIGGWLAAMEARIAELNTPPRVQPGGAPALGIETCRFALLNLARC